MAEEQANKGGISSKEHFFAFLILCCTSAHCEQIESVNDILSGRLSATSSCHVKLDHRSYERNFRNCVKKPEEFRTRDLEIPVRRSNQLSYEATDVGSWSFVGSNVPVRNESTMK